MKVKSIYFVYVDLVFVIARNESQLKDLTGSNGTNYGAKFEVTHHVFETHHKSKMYLKITVFSQLRLENLATKSI